ncbi:FAD-dependent oxidoreductase [Verrucomicrobia bacterium LW23]|nr:FAD-dependent oxidoreductase [Verrucomicrobia bacterium LW23]
MKSFSLSPRSLPLDESWDVIVVGGGPSGCTAAAAAAREGARTLLIEGMGALGGMGTSALVPAWCPFSDREKIVYRSLAERVLVESKKTTPHVPKEQLDWVPINPEALKRIYDDLVAEFGATPLFHTTLASVEMRADGEVDALIVANKAGLSALRARVYVDCTGDADLCFQAGAETVKGDGKEPASLMPATHCFVLSNVDDYALRTGEPIYAGNPKSPLYPIRESGRYPIIPDTHLCSAVIGPGTLGFNAGHVFNFDNTDPWSISRGLTHGRKLAQAYRDGLAEFAPAAFGNSFLVMTGAMMGVRETRRVMGDYLLTFDDYMARQSFDDEICRNSYFIDVHRKQEESAKNYQERIASQKKNELRYGPGESHGIPYRCLTPRGLRNVLVAGRCISTERIVQGSVRVMPTCLAMGEAAGLAAALAATAPEPNVHAVDTNHLRAKLRGYGAYISADTASPAEAARTEEAAVAVAG